MSGHTQEPWSYSEGNVYASDQSLIVTAVDASGHLDIAPEDCARRIVACVNACSGIGTDDLEKVPDAPMWNGRIIAELIFQRDQLLKALTKHRDWLATQIQIGQDSFDIPPQPISQFDYELSLCVSDMTKIIEASK
jgi:hypothetical protein